ncbi:sigma-70 family RNA polymerase sigma factor [Myxococcus sp. CA051A]|uniref:sigma-70 family RNA polymerase sigma factor n=1 Tax=Myxococcus sp. CA051A TaxID=2741739 RepID=UPI00157AD49C|nr:sigma-70 family RNA polymerase sigma factor [Myxococcus sp. CA051A]
MDEKNLRAEGFEAHRVHLRAVAYRMLGSLSDAEDAVQESWLHFSRADTHDVANLRGWLTTVVSRVCLDQLRSRESRREEPSESKGVELLASHAAGGNPEQESLMADSVGFALLVVLEALSPPERIAFVLHDMFSLTFDEIAPIVGRNATATRQLASRARRRVHGAALSPEAGLTAQRDVVAAFLSAARSGDLDALLAVLDPEIVARTDARVLPAGAPREARGAREVARQAQINAARGGFAQLGLINGKVGLIVAPGGRLRSVLVFTISDGKVLALESIFDPERLGRLELAVFPA